MNYAAPKVYAVKHKNEETRAASRSGGIFTALSDEVLKSGGAIYGCVLTEDFYAVHTRATNSKERDLMRGSKYIQSSMGDTFKNVEKDLKDGFFVLFSGTSCQIEGLRKFLGTEYENLLCVDIVCHGVPSPKVWQEYLSWQAKKNKNKVVKVDFRNKKDFGWTAHFETLTMEDGNNVNSEIFKNLFCGHNILRPSCYECPFKKIMHPGDITIADYWGIEKAAPGFSDNKGVSLVLVNNQKGETIFERVKDDIVCKTTRMEDSMQPNFKAPFQRPHERDKFWTDFNKKPFNCVARKYGDVGFLCKIKNELRKLKRKLMG